MATLDSVLIIRRPDGTFSRTFFLDKAIPKGISEEDFVNEQINIVVKREGVSDSDYFIKTKSELKTAFNETTLKSLGHLRIDADGEFYEDTDHKTGAQLLEERKASVRQKLKNAEPLTDDDIDLILGK